MTKRPIVYYGAIEATPMALYAGVENLFSHLKKASPMRNDEYFECPSFISWAKDKLVIKCPSDVTITGNVGQYVQFSFGDFFFFADGDVNMTMYPPFLDINNINGVVGEMNISKWFRAIQPVAVMGDEGQLKIQQDQALMYVGFDRPVRLEKIIYPKDIKGVSNTLMSYKNINMKGGSLKRLYESFMSARTNRTVLKMIKDYNDI